MADLKTSELVPTSTLKDEDLIAVSTHVTGTDYVSNSITIENLVLALPDTTGPTGDPGINGTNGTDGDHGLPGLIIGEIKAFPTDVLPLGFLECNGQEVSRVIYEDLYNVMGVKYGNGDASTTFTLPDYRGQFLRGVDHASGTDPDAVSRTDRGDGSIGDNVGTKQVDAFKSHSHLVTYTDEDGSPGDTAFRAGTNADTPKPTLDTGGAETRPTNISVLYGVAYQGLVNVQSGADGANGTPGVILSEIKAFPTSTLPDGFISCNGADVSRITYANLFDKIGVTYGSGDGVNTFTLPDYRGQFLRGFDSGSGTDVDAGARTDRGDGTTGDAVGTKQSDEVGTHKHAQSNSYYTGASSTYGLVSGGALSAHSPDTEDAGGNETRPTNISVFYGIAYEGLDNVSTGATGPAGPAGPAGSIIGEIKTFSHSPLPLGFLECDGSYVDRLTYNNLYSVIGVTYGTTTTENFRLPDYRGRFLRALDDGAGRDPDSASRNDRGDGTIGDAVGTTQGQEYKSHSHPGSSSLKYSNWSGRDGVQSNSIVTDSNTTNSSVALTTSSSGGSETRPKNINVIYGIAYDGTFDIVTGATGPAGPQGPQGPQGPAGPSGNGVMQMVAYASFSISNSGQTANIQYSSGITSITNLGGTKNTWNVVFTNGLMSDNKYIVNITGCAFGDEGSLAYYGALYNVFNTGNFKLHTGDPDTSSDINVARMQISVFR
jgi:microcystin-dependent protein